MLPTPDLNENTFSKSDALALGKLNSFLLHLFLFFCNLATFYSILLHYLTCHTKLYVMSSIFRLIRRTGWMIESTEMIGVHIRSKGQNEYV